MFLYEDRDIRESAEAMKLYPRTVTLSVDISFNNKVTNLFNLIRAIPLSACATHNSDESSEVGGLDVSVQPSAFAIMGSMLASSLSIRSQISDMLDFILSVESKSITN